MKKRIVGTSANRRGRSGFAVVVALLLVAFIFLIIALFPLMLQVESQVVANHVQQMKARQSALLGLKVALGELQVAAGPDQRITATASILGDSDNGYTSAVEVASGQTSWTGVWKSSTVNGALYNLGNPEYNPANPDTKEFVAWLVSATDNTGAFALPTDLSDAGTNVSSKDSVEGVDNYLSLYNNADGTAYAQVEKVLIAKENEAEHYFAFWVEDEAVKADLSWNEWSDDSVAGYQASRLSAVAGPDYAAFDSSSGSNPFSENGVIEYPLTMNEGNPFLSASVSKLQNPSDLDAAIGGVDPNWLRDQRQHMTVGSWGLLTDVKWGGFRRDLSLAFEMDGDADVTATQQPTKFNQQVGEFVGNGDRLSSPYLANGMTEYERFLWRDTNNGTTTEANFFNGDLVGGNATVRGPNWWALRDYANLYKRLEASGGDYVLPTRTYYPNSSGGAYTYNFVFDDAGTPQNWDMEIANKGRYVYRPARTNYAPVYLGCVYWVSLVGNNTTATTIDIGVGLDPMFYFWNPYNHKLSFPHLSVVLRKSLPGRVNLKAGSSTTTKEVTLKDLLIGNTSNVFDDAITTYLVRDPNGPIVLEPGEVVIASVTSTPGEAVLGFATDNTSGIIMDQVASGSLLTVDLTDTVDYVFRTKGGRAGNNKYAVDISLPNASKTVSDMYTSSANWGDQIQSQMVTLIEANSDLYYSNHAKSSGTPYSEDASYFTGGTKKFIGLYAHLMRPAYFGDTHAIQLEPFARYNPMPMVIRRDFNSAAMPNQVYSIITSDDYLTLLDESQVSFSASPRNAFWGFSYKSGEGSTHVPMIDIPSTPLMSLASFANTNLSLMAMEPMKAVGNSWHNPSVPAGSIYGDVINTGANTIQDISWLINDALFDRYYLSGFAPEFSIGGSGYSANGSMTETLTQFYSKDYFDAQANPVLRPYLPRPMQADEVVTALAADDGYKKLGAYSVINGAFNVNSTSVEAWKAFLRGNRDLAVEYSDGGSDEAEGTPFPKGILPRGPGAGAQEGWSGVERLSDQQIADLAEAIVEEVKGRGPFMSISDFVNRRVGTPVRDDTHYAGALQSAIDVLEAEGSINQTAQEAATTDLGDIASTDYTANWKFFKDAGPSNETFRKTTTGIASSITQADLLLPLAPRLTARADTFRVRAYGEVRSEDGSSVVSRALCEAVVQRLPEYVDSASNEPWDELTDPVTPSASSDFELSTLNQALGRQFTVVKFRWLSTEEI